MQVPSAYRRAASAVFVTLALAAVAVSCADYTGPLAPDGGPDPAAAWKNAVDSTGVLDWDGEIGIATGTPPECDPEVEIIECDPPDGGGGYVDDNVACSNCTPLEPSRLQTLQDATPEICAPHRTAVAGALNNGEWGKFTYSSSAYRGNHDKEHTHAYHYCINTNHPGFTGTLANGGQIGPAQKRIELAGTLVHEHLHHINPGKSDFGYNGIDALTKQCVPAYLGT